MTVPAAANQNPTQKLELGLYPDYCFNTRMSILLGYYSFGSLMNKFNAVVPFQNKSLPRLISFHEGVHDNLTAKVEVAELLPIAGAALAPPHSAIPAQNRAQIDSGAAAALIVQKTPPIYPEDAKKNRVQGKVLMRALIGIDGRIHDLRLVSAPSAALASSAFWAVSTWQYKPYLLHAGWSRRKYPSRWITR